MLKLPVGVLTYTRQLPRVQAFVQLLLRILNRSLDRWAVASYGQTGEDRIIDSLMPQDVRKFYVDAGCHHPRRFSNTFALYLKGWIGVTIDANPIHVAAHKKERPNDTQVCCALSSQESADVIFTEFAESAVSSLSERHVGEWRKTFAVVNQRRVRTVTLNDVLRDAGAPKEFGLLTIDVEGHDLEVLRGLDLNEFRPRLIIIEMHDFSLDQTTPHQVVEYLRRADYGLSAFAVMNGYFRDMRTMSRRETSTLPETVSRIIPR